MINLYEIHVYTSYTKLRLTYSDRSCLLTTVASDYLGVKNISLRLQTKCIPSLLISYVSTCPISFFLPFLLSFLLLRKRSSKKEEEEA